MHKRYFSESDIEDIYLLLEQIKHLQGQHNQHAHGNRWRSSLSGNHRELIHRGGGKPGRNVKPGEVVQTLRKPQNASPKKNPPQEKPSVPDSIQKYSKQIQNILTKGVQNGEKIDSSFLDFAKKQHFDGLESYNDTFKFQVEGKNFFAKKATDAPKFGVTKEEVLHNELRATAMAEAMGIEGHYTPVSYTEHKGSTYMIQDWLDGAKPALSDEGESAIRSLSKQDLTKLLAYEYLTGDTDRHAGNVMLANGKVREIDFGFSQQYSTEFDPYSTVAVWSGSNRRTIDKDTIDSILSKKDSILAAARKYPTGNSTALIQTRLKKLSNAVKSTKYGTWYDIGQSINS